MSLPQSALIIHTALSLNNFHMDCRRPVLASPSMTFPQAKKPLFSLRPKGTKRRESSQESMPTFPGTQRQQDITKRPMVTCSSVEGQHPVLISVQDILPDGRFRKRDFSVLQWLDEQARRIHKFHDSLWASLDSPGSSDDDDGTATIKGPNGEPIFRSWLDEYFKKHPAGGSNWRNSTQWEKFVAEKSKDPTMAPVERRPNPERLSKRPLFSKVSWGGRFSKRRKREEKMPGNVAPDDLEGALNSPDEYESPSPRSKASRSPAKARRRPAAPSLHLSFDYHVAQPSTLPHIDTSQIPSPPVADLKPQSSEGFDANDLSHMTGRPREISPIHIMNWPLSESSNPPPSAPRLKPGQHNTPVPKFRLLADSYLYPANSRVPSDDSSQSNVSRSLSAGPGATNIQYWPAQPSSTSANITTPAPQVDDDQYRDLRSTFEATTIANISEQNKDLELRATGQKDISAVPTIQQAANPPARNLPATLDSRQDSKISQPTPPPKSDTGTNPQPTSSSHPAHHPPTATHPSTNIAPRPLEPDSPDPASSPVEPRALANGPADRNWQACVISDTARPSMPDGDGFVSREEQHRRCEAWWAGYVQRPGRFRKVGERLTPRNYE